MGYIFLVANCGACKKTMTCNPERVPSITLNGVKEPLCRECVRLWEQLHGQTIDVHPDAYGGAEV